MGNEMGRYQPRIIHSLQRKACFQKLIGGPEVEAVVARIARVPVHAVTDDERDKLPHLEVGIKAVLFGRSEPPPAVRRILAWC
jgi:ATP-dependent Clp protease ATP-binding subunit ClpA